MKGIAEYKQNAVETQTPGRIVVLLYEGAVKFLRQAVAELEARRFVEKGQYIGKAVAILEELNGSLDMEVGGEIAQNLRQLYFFMIRRLNQANFDRNPEIIREVITLLEQLNSGWKGIQQ
jgi:flagellar secretion chaperone FliS